MFKISIISVSTFGFDVSGLKMNKLVDFHKFLPFVLFL